MQKIKSALLGIRHLFAEANHSADPILPQSYVIGIVAGWIFVAIVGEQIIVCISSFVGW